MSKIKTKLKICANGHEFYKSSDCPVCPVCEKNNQSNDDFLSKFAAPARRALENNGITQLEDLAKFTEKEILHFHGIGKSTIKKFNELLKNKGLCFRQ